MKRNLISKRHTGEQHRQVREGGRPRQFGGRAPAAAALEVEHRAGILEDPRASRRP